MAAPLIELDQVSKHFFIPTVRRETVREHVLGVLDPRGSQKLQVLDRVSLALALHASQRYADAAAVLREEAQELELLVGQAELAAVPRRLVAGDVDQQIAEQPVDQPRPRRFAFARCRDQRQRDVQLIQQIVARLVDARRLAGRADEQARKQI